MKTSILSYILLFSITLFSQNKNSSTGFIENKGQIIDQNGKPNNKVKYLLNTNGLNVQIRENGFSYDIYETKKHKLSKKEIAKQNPFPDVLQERNKLPDYKLEYIYHRIDIDFLNSRKNTKIIAEEKSIDYDNYYNVIGKPEGVLNVHKYKQITYENIYPNIDVVFSIPNDSLKPVEYNFVVKPNGKISDIQLKFNGAKTELLDNKIKLNVRFGTMEEILPMSWIENGKSKTEVTINYKKLAKNVYGFESDFDNDNKTVIIDPVPIRLWGTYYGGSGDEFVGSINIDSNNNVFISGSTESSNNISTSGPNTSGYYSGSDFIAKFDTNGQRIWSSYYPFDTSGMKLDNQNNIYLYGSVSNNTPQIPSIGCYQAIKDDYSSCFLIKLNPLGAKIWGTYYGGSHHEGISSVAVDSNYNIYVVGSTNTFDTFASVGAFQSTKLSPGSLQNGFVAKFDSNGNRIWGTFYGGSLSDGFFYSDISNDGYLYCVGIHNSIDNIATPGSYQPTSSGHGGMIVKFDLNGDRIWGTYIADNCSVFRGKLKDDKIVISGVAYSDGLGTSGTMQENMLPLPTGAILSGNTNSYIAKFNIQSQQLVWGTYFFEQISSFDMDSNENIIFSGATGINTGLTTPDGYMPTKGFYIKAYMIKLNNLGQKVWGTYYGGNGGEQVTRTKIDNNNDIYLFGNTYGSTTGIATPGAHQTTMGSNPDTYIAKFRDCLSVTSISSNSPICINSSLNLSASGGTNYNWIGPNGFNSNLQNPVISNANSIHNGSYTCLITGTTGGCDGSLNINVSVIDNTKPIPNQTTLPTITGDCNTIISTIPTATDNCAGIINGTTTDALSYALPGTYTINWKYDDGNGNTETQEQSIVITTVVLPTLTSPQTFCIQQNPTLNSIAISGQNIKWYDAQTLGNLLPNSTILVNGSTYYASQTINSCESLRVPIAINIQNTPAPTGNANQSFCATQNATLNEIVISGNTLNWYSSPSSTVILPTTTLLVSGSTYYATQTLNGCESINRLAVTITLTTTLNANNYSKSFCDDLDDGLETILLSDYNSFLLPSVTNEVFTYYNSNLSAENQIQSDKINPNYTLTTGTHTVFVRIDSSNGCHQVVELNLTLFSNPFINLKDIIPICENKDITVNAGNGFDSYTWSTGITNQQSILITQPGSYSLTVTKNNGSITCSSTKNFTVVNSNIASISSIETLDWTDNQNTISVFLSPSSVGNYEYSLDGIKYQDSPIFDNLLSGFYTVYVNDKNNCGEITDEVFVLMYPTFFTPNNDGYNDYWKIKLSELEPGLNIKIFDQYGKFIKLLDNDDIGWDGTLNQKPLPADDYWFVITRANGKEYRNHFTLKR